jgi:hypothetical protein
MTELNQPIINWDKPLPLDLAVLCQPIPGMPQELKLTLPGGVDLKTIVFSSLPPSLFGYANQVLNMADTAMAPLTPVFKIIETIAAIQKCLTAIPGILGPPPNPKKLLDALVELGQKVEELASLMPIFSIPVLMLQLIDTLIGTIDGAASELSSLAVYTKQIQQAQFVAAQAPGLIALISCAQQSRDTQMSNVEKVFASINVFIDVINAFGTAAGLTHLIPPFDGIWPDDPLEMAHRLQAIADDLRAVRSYIPA